MNKNLTSYLTPKLDKFLDDDDKFRKYIVDCFKSSDFEKFEQYLKTTSDVNYQLYSENLAKYHKKFDCGYSNLNGECITDFSVNEFSVESLSGFIFSNKNLMVCLKKYLRGNPLSVLVHSDDFLSLVGNFISPHIQGCTGVIFVDIEDHVSFFLNNVSRNNYVSLNLSFLRICLNTLLKKYTGDNCALNLNIANNKLTLSYGGTEYSCILVNKRDMNGVFESFGYANNKEKLLAVDIFYTKDISYEFFIFYFSKIHRYTSEKYSVFQMWVVEKYSNIMDIDYFRRIAEEYSVGISVLMHSICPFADVYESSEQLNPALNERNKDSFAFSLALWLYNKRGYYYDNKLMR